MGHQIIKKLSFSVLYSISVFSFADSIIVQSTTSTKNSGLYDYLLPKVSSDTGVKVNVVAVGTGQAIKNAQRCDGDVLLVHAKASEETFVAKGFGIERHDVMYNDFVIVGPANDPASIKGSNDVSEALKKIAITEAIFASRGMTQEHIKQNSGFGKTVRSILPKHQDSGIGKQDPAWAQHSTSLSE